MRCRANAERLDRERSSQILDYKEEGRVYIVVKMKRLRADKLDKNASLV